MGLLGQIEAKLEIALPPRLRRLCSCWWDVCFLWRCGWRVWDLEGWLLAAILRYNIHVSKLLRRATTIIKSVPKSVKPTLPDVDPSHKSTDEEIWRVKKFPLWHIVYVQCNNYTLLWCFFRWLSKARWSRPYRASREDWTTLWKRVWDNKLIDFE